jgi:hypothetical protein
VAGSNAVPLLEAAAAAGRGRVLGDEDRVAAPWRLPSIVRRLGRSEAPGDEVARVADDDRHSLLREVGGIPGAEAEARAESRAGKGGEDVVEVAQMWMGVGE